MCLKRTKLYRKCHEKQGFVKHRKSFKVSKSVQGIPNANQSGSHIHSHGLPDPNPDAVFLIVAMDASHEFTNL